MVKRRAVILEIVRANFQLQHRITHILRMLKISSLIYYDYRH